MFVLLNVLLVSEYIMCVYYGLCVCVYVWVCMVAGVDVYHMCVHRYYLIPFLYSLLFIIDLLYL